MNDCTFSDDRRYRFVLKHRWDDLMSERAVMWIGLNPSVADEHRLDPTLTRIKAFSQREGFNCFYMCNLFALVATDPRVMKADPEPEGMFNDFWIYETAQKVEKVIACWGPQGKHRGRDKKVRQMLRHYGVSLECLAVTKDGSPGHPLYLPSKAILSAFGCIQYRTTIGSRNRL